MTAKTDRTITTDVKTIFDQCVAKGRHYTYQDVCVVYVELNGNFVATKMYLGLYEDQQLLYPVNHV